MKQSLKLVSMSFPLAPCEALLLSGLVGSERLSAKTRIENLSYFCSRGLKKDSGQARHRRTSQNDNQIKEASSDDRSQKSEVRFYNTNK
jgi:hypothetical protein